MRWYLCSWAAVGLALGNDTALNPAGHDPSPMGALKGEESVIRMVSEKIDITFGKKTSKVHCRFVFQSTKEGGDAKQTVGFPDIVGESDVGRIVSMTTKIDGREIAARKEKGWFLVDDEQPRGGLGVAPENFASLAEDAEFHAVEVTFPEGKEVIIERDYVVENGGSVMGNTTFGYTTLTGAIWKGNIGRAEFSVTLEGWTLNDLAFEDGPQKIEPRTQRLFCSVNKSAWTVETPTRMTLVWENFEPAVHQSRRSIFLTTWNRP